MSIKSIKSGYKGISALAGNLPIGDFESIQTVVGTGSAVTLSFTSIPSTYKHLQIRYIGRMNGANTGYAGTLRFNSDTGSNYARHFLRGRNSTASAGNATSQTAIGFAAFPAANSTANIVAAGVIDVLDYSNSNKYTTIRGLAGIDQNQVFDDSSIIFNSGLWMDLSVITSIDIISDGAGREWTTQTQFALYGIR
jgi:hypothetical protein